MARRGRALHTTKYKLSEVKFQNEEQKKELEELFRELERYKGSLVEDYRRANEAIADLDVSRAMALKSQVKLLRLAGEVIPMVKVEPQWWVYRDKEGEVIFESAFTERDYRNASRAQKAGLSREIQSEDGADLFEKDEDEHESEGHIGFD